MELRCVAVNPALVPLHLQGALVGAVCHARILRALRSSRPALQATGERACPASRSAPRERQQTGFRCSRHSTQGLQPCRGATRGGPARRSAIAPAPAPAQLPVPCACGIRGVPGRDLAAPQPPLGSTGPSAPHAASGPRSPDRCSAPMHRHNCSQAADAGASGQQACVRLKAAAPGGNRVARRRPKYAPPTVNTLLEATGHGHERRTKEGGGGGAGA